ncbi:CYTH domain-containing protein [Prochlorococcus sp. MIT 1341]|uniref:CYTH domain-containing protein n=1 Tax=Prochlorococcus sp. MIT 1341 TaxID=3096221 RepID=UPI002A74F16E|nr:CYTH domain-containing protein [Prochlorococcus sp. MIT 1341]
MSLEIERRFLVASDDWKSKANGSKSFRQCYLLASETGIIVRVRIISNHQSWLTIKAPAKGIANHEFEYLIPNKDAQTLWTVSQHRLVKTRYQLAIDGGDWIVDCFEGENFPLVLAEVELPTEDFPVDIPEWCGEEITGEISFSNASLARVPFSQWEVKQQKAFFRE